MAENTTCESEAFASKQARLKSCINPDDLTVKCYSKGIISKDEFEEVDNDMLSRPKKADKLLSAIGESIKKSPANYRKFLAVLASEPTNKKFVEELEAALETAKLSKMPSLPDEPVATVAQESQCLNTTSLAY